MNTAKYIVTGSGSMIVFSAAIIHKEFEDLNPVSAGFISFSTGEDGEVVANCHGESISLGIKSNPEKDNRIAKFQILAKPCNTEKWFHNY